jgi:hypothetical protein
MRHQDVPEAHTIQTIRPKDNLGYRIEPLNFSYRLGAA